MMKRLTLVPKTDTITICLPPEWVGKVINCTLRNTDEEENVAYPMAAERSIPYFVNKPKRQKK